MKTEFKKFLDQIWDQIEKPLVDARFGDQWIEHQKEMMNQGQISVDDILDIAWKQGRRGILLERALKKSLPSDQEIQAMSEEIYGSGTFKNLGQKVSFCEHLTHLKHTVLSSYEKHT